MSHTRALKVFVPRSAARTRRRRGGVVGIALSVAIVAILGGCGSDDSGSSTGAGGGGGNGGGEALTLNEAQAAEAEAAVTAMRSAQDIESGVHPPTFMYSPVDGFLTLWPGTDGRDPVEWCQLAADAVAELDGPPATVPVSMIDYIDGGEGEFEVLASGVGGGTCTAGE